MALLAQQQYAANRAAAERNKQQYQQHQQPQQQHAQIQPRGRRPSQQDDVAPPSAAASRAEQQRQHEEQLKQARLQHVRDRQALIDRNNHAAAAQGGKRRARPEWVDAVPPPAHDPEPEHTPRGGQQPSARDRPPSRQQAPSSRPSSSESGHRRAESDAITKTIRRGPGGSDRDNGPSSARARPSDAPTASGAPKRGMSKEDELARLRLEYFNERKQLEMKQKGAMHGVQREGVQRDAPEVKPVLQQVEGRVDNKRAASAPSEAGKPMSREEKVSCSMGV